MKTIQIVFTKSRKKFAIFSWLIRLFENTNYSHVAISMMDSDIDAPIFFQSSHTMVNCMGEYIFKKENEIVSSFEFEVEEDLLIECKKFAVKRLGIPYGKLSTLGLAWVQLNKLFGRTITNPFNKTGETYVCSQFIAALLENTNIIDVYDLDDITPSCLYPIIEQLPKKLEWNNGEINS